MGNGYNVSHGKNESEQKGNGSFFNTSKPYPTVYFNNTRIDEFRGYKILTFVLHPVYYIKDTGEIFYYKNITVTIKTNYSSYVSPLFRGLSNDEEIMKQKVDDYTMNDSYISYPNTPENTSIVHSGESYDYVIITSKALKNSLSLPIDRREWYTFQDLADYKNSTGTKTTVVTIEAIYDIPPYNDNEDDPPNAIRNFIKHAYELWKIEYVLIGGDIDIVPARDLWYHYKHKSIDEIRKLPSDLYYACLIGPWNDNNNGYWGEPWDGEDGKDVNLESDVFIGRASVENPIEVNNFVKKTISYDVQIKQLDHDPFLKKTLMVGLRFSLLKDAFGKELKDKLIDTYDYEDHITQGIPSSNFIIDSLYDKDRMPFPGSKKGWSTENLIEKINNHVLIINVAGHGLYNQFFRNVPLVFGHLDISIPKTAFENTDVYYFVNSKYFFIYAQNCFVGGFDWDEDDCLAEYLTVKTEHGAFAAVMNSREGWGAPPMSSVYQSQRYDREFFDAIFGENIHELGKANADSKEDNLHYIGGDYSASNTMRQCYYQLNLFGDPQLSIKIPDENSPPNQPTLPTFHSKSRKWYESKWTYTFTTKAIDPNGDNVQFRLRYRKDGSYDYTYSDWQEWYSSGETAYVTIKIPYGEYFVSAQATDGFKDSVSTSCETNVKVSFNLDMQIESSTAVIQEQVQFNGQASGGTAPYNTWFYDFGDGSNSTEQNTTHSYDTVGTYNVNMTVIDDNNITTNYAKIIDVVILKSDFESSLGIAVSNEQETFNFDDKSKGYYNIVNWSWDFGDGNISYQRNTSNSYSSEGAYNVSLTVSDEQSNNDTAYMTIYIDSVSPTIFSVYNNFDIAGYGSNVTIFVNTSDNSCGIKNVKVNITYPDSSYINCSMNYTIGNIYEYVFSDCWQLGEYSYEVWVSDQADNNDSNSTGSFVVSRNFGYNQIGFSNQSIFDTITGSVFKVNEKGVADNISVYLDPGNTSSDYHYRCAIYKHNNSELVGISEEKNISGFKGWQMFNFSVPKPVLLNDTDYIIGCWSDNYTVKMYYDNETGTEGYYDDGSSTLQGHYFIGVYNYTPDTIYFYHEDRKYSIYCCYTPDNTSPVITNASDSPDPAGFGFNVTITADIIEYQSGVDIIKVNITYPNSTEFSYNMNHLENDTYNFVFNDTWLKGQYNYSLWTVDYANNNNISTSYSFNISGQADISVCTLNNSYTNNCTVNLTDPPSSSYAVGYELLDDGDVLHIWNNLDHYYFDTDSGIQLTNHYNEYWSHNVLMLGYYNNDEWNLIYRTDELSEFNKEIESDNESYVNATLWKDLNYAGYDFRLAIRYHLGFDDNELTIIPYIKNIDDEDIPYNLGFAWEIKDIQIDMTEENDYIEIDGTTYYLNEENLDETYTNMDVPSFYIKEDKSDTKSESLYLRWNENLNYKVQVKSREGQYNAPVTLGIKIGTLDVGQEKSTELFWHDATEVIYYFNDYDPIIVWATNPAYMADGNTSNYASTTIDRDMEVLNIILESTADKGAISKVEIRAFGKYSGSGYPPHDIVLKTVGGTHYFIPGTTGDWSSWYDITNNPNAPNPWTWTDIDNLVVEVEAATEGAYTLHCSKVDVRVTYNPNPVISNPYPSSGSNGITIAPVLNITVSDPEGDTMNITWLSNSSGSWQVFGTNFSVGNGTYHQMFSNATVNGQWWYWKVNVSDGTNTVTSNVFSFYTGFQSKIENTGSTNFTGYLLMQIEYYNTTNSTWILEQVVVNESTPRTINAGCTLALDTIFNPYNVSTSSFTNGNGTYRVYAAFRDPDGDVLVCNDESLLEANYQFTVSFS